jgi:hypothetical protein
MNPFSQPSGSLSDLRFLHAIVKSSTWSVCILPSEDGTGHQIIYTLLLYIHVAILSAQFHECQFFDN